MKINSSSGLLDSAQFIPSSNCDERLDGMEADLLVIHNISLPPGEFGGPYIEQLFTNRLNPKEHPFFDEIKSLQVSSHLLIRRDGTILQFVPFHKRAWHAGVSAYQGREHCNDFSIGIELEGTDEQPFEQVQYQQLKEVIKTLIKTYPSLSEKHITGHSDIAPGRKTDPGPYFDWQRLNESLLS